MSTGELAMESKEAGSNVPKESSLAAMSTGYDQPADPPSYDQSTAAPQPPYPGAYPGAYPGQTQAQPYPAAAHPGAVHPVIVQQPQSHMVIVQQGRQPVDQGWAIGCLVVSIFSCLCCLWPIGLVAIIFAALAMMEASNGNAEKSRCYSITATVLNAVSIIGGIICIIVIIVVVINASDDDDDYYGYN